MFSWDPKSQGKEKPLMNGVYHNEMLVYSREHNQYNKTVTAYRIGENCCVIRCQGFIVVSYLKNTNGIENILKTKRRPLKLAKMKRHF